MNVTKRGIVAGASLLVVLAVVGAGSLALTATADQPAVSTVEVGLSEPEALPAESDAPVAPAVELVPVAPAPVPEPEPAPRSGGDWQAGDCSEYNDANECTAWYVP